MSVIYVSSFMCVDSGRPKRLFVFVNPYGGKKSASKIFQNDVKPLLDDASVEYTIQGWHSYFFFPLYVVDRLEKIFEYVWCLMCGFIMIFRNQIPIAREGSR